MATQKSKKWMIALAIILGGMTPILLYWWAIGSVPTIKAAEAIQLLNLPGEKTVLVDVRDAEVYDQQHISGAHHWPLAEASMISSLDQIPSYLQNKTLLLICDSGDKSAGVIRKLQKIGLDNIYNVRGGLQEWVKAGARMSDLRFSQFVNNSTPNQYGFKELSLLDQGAAVLSIAVIKPLYTVLSLVLIWYLWGSKSMDLLALRWGMVFFFIGEAFCGINVIFFDHSSWLSEYFHSYGMVLAFSFAIFAIMEGFDNRMIIYSNPDKKCAALKICNSCYKYKDVDCGVKKLLLILIPIFIALSMIPLLTLFSLESYNSNIFGVLFHNTHPVVFQIYERRILPILAISIFGLAFISIILKENKPLPHLSRILIAGGLGCLGFSMFRLVFVMIFEENLVWFSFWEEFTELIFVMAVIAILLIFRKNLLREIPSVIQSLEKLS
jgi:rhodanese-related sulfurtransferase